MDEPRRSARDDDPGQSPWSRPRDVPPTEDPPAQDAPAAGEPTRRLPTYSQDPAAYVRGPYGRGSYERGPDERGPQEPYEHQTGPMPPSAFGSPAYAEPGFPVEPEKTGRRHSVALVGTVVAGVCLLLIGLGGGYLVAVGFDDSGNAVPAAGVGGQAQANRLNSPQSAPGRRPPRGRRRARDHRSPRSAAAVSAIRTRRRPMRRSGWWRRSTGTPSSCGVWTVMRAVYRRTPTPTSPRCAGPGASRSWPSAISCSSAGPTSRTGR